MAVRRLEARVSGRVQGVFFRAATVRAARPLGVTGFVRNTADGRVEVVAEGGEGALRRLLAFLREGPPAARVEGVEARWLPPRGGFSGFGVRY